MFPDILGQVGTIFVKRLIQTFHPKSLQLSFLVAFRLKNARRFPSVPLVDSRRELNCVVRARARVDHDLERGLVHRAAAELELDRPADRCDAECSPAQRNKSDARRQ